MRVDSKANTVVIEHLDLTVESDSQNRVLLAPKTKTKSDLITKVQLMKLAEIVSSHPLKEQYNLRHIDKTTTPPESANKQHKYETVSITDQQET